MPLSATSQGLLYNKYVGTNQRTLNLTESQSGRIALGPYVRVVGVQFDDSDNLRFEVADVHGTEVSSACLVRGAPAELVASLCKKLRRDIFASCPQNKFVQDMLVRHLVTHEQSMRLFSNTPELLGVAGTTCAAVLMRLFTALPDGLIPPNPALHSEVATSLVGAWKRAQKDLAVDLNDPTKLQLSAAEDHGRVQANASKIGVNFILALQSIPSIYRRLLVVPIQQQQGRLEQELAKATEQKKKLEDGLKAHDDIQAKRREIEGEATSTAGTAKERTQRLAKLNDELAKLIKKRDTNEVWKTHLAAVLEKAHKPEDVESIGERLKMGCDTIIKERRQAYTKERELASAQEAEAESLQQRFQQLLPSIGIDDAAGPVLGAWVAEVVQHVLPLKGQTVHALSRALEWLPSSVHGALLVDLERADCLGADTRAEVVQTVERRVAAMNAQAVVAHQTGTCTECELCYDLQLTPHAGAAASGGGLKSLCGWHSGVCHAGQCACWTGPQAGTTYWVEAHQVCLQPMPALLWLGLQDDATIDDVSNAYRKLTRRDHPDRGGRIDAWEVTQMCHHLLKDAGGLEAYVAGRNHSEFVLRAEGGTDAHAPRSGLAEKKNGATGTAAAGGERAHDARGVGQRVPPRKDLRALEDQYSAIVRMPKPMVHLHHRKSRSVAVVKVSWVAKNLAHYQFVVEYQKACGRQEVSPWAEEFRGQQAYYLQTVTDESDEYVSEHSFRVKAVGVGQAFAGVVSEWSEPVSIVVDLADDQNAEETMSEQRRNERLRRHVADAQQGVASARQGTLSLGEMQRVLATVEQIIRADRKSAFGALVDAKGDWRRRLVGASGLNANVANLPAVVNWLTDEIRGMASKEYKAEALRQTKTTWRALLQRLSDGATTSSAASAALAAFDSVLGEVETHVARCIAEVERARAARNEQPKEGAPAIDDEEKAQLRATLINLTKQKKEALVLKVKELRREEEAEARRAAALAERERAAAAKPRARPAVFAAITTPAVVSGRELEETLQTVLAALFDESDQERRSAVQRLAALVEHCEDATAAKSIGRALRDFGAIEPLLALLAEQPEVQVDTLKVVGKLASGAIDAQPGESRRLLHDLDAFPRVLPLLHSRDLDEVVPCALSIVLNLLVKPEYAVLMRDEKADVQLRQLLASPHQIVRQYANVVELCLDKMHTLLQPLHGSLPADANAATAPSKAPGVSKAEQTYTYELLQSLTGEWADVARLGSGGSGSVYRAVIDGTPVAVKRFHSDGSGASAAWQTELQLLSNSVHPNLVPLFGSSSDGPAVCLVYHYANGGSVEQRLAREPIGGGAPPPVLTPSQRVIILSDVCRGLAHLHSIGVVHRDIKPGNILLQQVQSGLRACIGDFGIARAMEVEAATMGAGTMMSRSRTWQGASAAGTLVYMAPEYLKSSASTTKVDSFAFGLTLLVLLVGRPAEREVASRRAGEDPSPNLLEFFYDEVEEDEATLFSLLDPTCSAHGSAGAWDNHLETVRQLHDVASRCLQHRARQRAELRELVPEFESARAAAEECVAAEASHRDEFCCPLSLERMVDPVIAADGVTYERTQIEQWLRAGKNTSPSTGERLAHTHLTPNLALKALILA